jgi:hypothetical protein
MLAKELAAILLKTPDATVLRYILDENAPCHLITEMTVHDVESEIMVKTYTGQYIGPGMVEGKAVEAVIIS